MEFRPVIFQGEKENTDYGGSMKVLARKVAWETVEKCHDKNGELNFWEKIKWKAQIVAIFFEKVDDLQELR